jgi:transcriptional regulator with XRE-family HTH domain
MRNLRTSFYPRLSAKEFAEKAGVTQNYLSKIESGALIVPREKELMLLAEQFTSGNDYRPIIKRLHLALEKQEFLYDPNDAWSDDIMLIIENDFTPTKSILTSHSSLREGELLRLKKTKLIYTVPIVERALKDVPDTDLLLYRELPYPLDDDLVLLHTDHTLQMDIYDDALLILDQGSSLITAYYRTIDDWNYKFEWLYKIPFNEKGDYANEDDEDEVPPGALYLKTATLGQYLDYRKSSLLPPS